MKLFLLICLSLFIFQVQGQAQDREIHLPGTNLTIREGVAHSNDKLIANFRNSAVTAIEQAQKQGLQSVQGVSLEDLKKTARQTHILYNSNFLLRQPGRRCAYWSPARKNVRVIGGKSHGQLVDTVPVITLYPDCESISEEGLAALAVHEFLGVGFNADLNYESSTEIFTYSAAKAKLPTRVLDLQTLQKKQTDNFKEMRSGGGATGVGGGGDYHDLRFKLEGLKHLRRLQDAKYFGVPVDLMEVALRSMKVKAASDIQHKIEFRVRNIEGDYAVAYVHSSLYRAEVPSEELGQMALLAARLFVLYAPEDGGLAEQKSLPYIYDSDVIRQRNLVMPTTKKKYVVWTNPEIAETPDMDLGDLLLEAVKFSFTPEAQELEKVMESIWVRTSK